jgi:hypothetical protein
MVIFLTIVLSKIEALGTRKETGPDLGIESVGDSLDSLILAVLSYRRELKKVSTCDDLTSVMSLGVTYLQTPKGASIPPDLLTDLVDSIKQLPINHRD